jgi:hypothetical protein
MVKRKIITYIGLITLFTLFLLPFSGSNVLSRLILAGSHKALKNDVLLSKSEMARSVLINGMGQYFVDLNYPELRSALYYDDLSSQAKAIIAVEVDSDVENAFRMDAYGVLIEAIYGEIIANQGMNIGENTLPIEAEIIEARLSFSDKLLEKFIIDVNDKTLAYVTDYGVDLHCRYFWDREISKSILQIEKDVSGVELSINKIPLCLDDLMVRVTSTYQLTDLQKKEIVKSITGAHPAYTFHYIFTDASEASYIIFNDLSQTLIEIVAEEDDIKFSYQVRAVCEK